MRFGKLTGVQAMLLASSAALALANAPAVAQEAAKPPTEELKRDKPAREEDIVVTGARLTSAVIGDEASLGILGNRDIVDTPFSVTALNERLFENTIALNLTELLTRDPSVRAINNSAGFTDDFRIRGFDVSRAAFLYDGIPGLLQSDGIRGISNLERVEVFRGVNTFTGGTPGIGGTINLVPKRPGTAEVNQITAGYVTEQLFAEADFSRRLGPSEQFGVRFNAQYANGDGAVNGFRRRTENYVLHLDWRPIDTLTFAVEGTSFRSRSSYYRDNLFLGQGVAIPEPPDPKTNYSQPWAFIEVSGERVFSKATWEFSPDWILSAGGGKVFGADNNGFYTASAEVTDDMGTLSIFPFRSFQPILDSSGTQVKIDGRFKTGIVEHKVSLNYTYFERTFGAGNFAGPTLQSNLLRPVILPEPPISFTGINGRLNTKTKGIGGFYEVGLFDGRLSVLAGAQHVSISTQSEFSGEGRVFDDAAIAPFGAISFKPEENLLIYASYTEGLEEGATAPPTAVNAFEAFAPRASIQYEAGVKAEFGELLLSGAVFEITRPLEFLNQDNIFVSDGDQTHRGVELQASGGIGEDVRLIGGVTYIDASVDNGNPAVLGNRPVGVPEWTASLYGEYDTPFARGFTISGGMNYQSGSFLDLENLANREADGFITFDLGARYAIKVNDSAFTLRFLVSNLFEEVYWVNDGGLALSPPRTFRLSLTADF